MKRLVVTIDADMFEGSAVGLERQLACRKGIGRVDVNPRTHTVRVDFDDRRMKRGDVERIIAECGYHGYCASPGLR